MSVRASTWAWDLGRDGTVAGGKLLTLLRIADHADNDGICWPGERSLADYTGQGETTVRGHLRQLEETGHLLREHRAAEKGRGRQPDRILLHLDQPADLAGEKPDDQPAADARPTGSSPQPSNKGTVKNHQQRVNKKVVTETEYDLASAVIASFNTTAGTSLSVDPHLTPIVGRIRERPDLTAEHHRILIEAVFAADHWWTDPPGPRIIYGNPAQFEQSLEIARRAVSKQREDGDYDPNAELERVRKEQGLD